MGLAERRATKEFQDKQFPELSTEIQKLAGFPVPIQVTWDQLAVEGRSNLYKESWPELYFKPVIEALRQIGRDQMGKDAIKAGLKKVEIRNSKGAYSPTSAMSPASDGAADRRVHRAGGASATGVLRSRFRHGAGTGDTCNSS